MPQRNPDQTTTFLRHQFVKDAHLHQREHRSEIENRRFVLECRFEGALVRCNS